MERLVWVDFKSGSLSLSDLPGCFLDEFGAECTFTGKVRKFNHGREVVRLCYDINKGLAKTVIREICEDALKEQKTKGSLEVIHAYGDLRVGETSVIVRAHTPHRKEAFHMCRVVIEQLKHRAPVWKKEYYTDGESEWLEGHALCQHGDQH